MAKLRSNDHPVSPERCWVRCELFRKGISLKAVAEKADRSVSLVSQVIFGFKNSDAVESALAETLGFTSYKDLTDAACRQAKRGVA